MDEGRDLPPDRRISVAIVDDSALLVETLVAALGFQSGFDVVATAGDADQAVAVVLEVEPDVVLLDLRLGDTWGLDVVPALRAGPNPPAIVVFSAASDLLTGEAVSQAEVQAQVSKGAPIEEIAAVLRAAVAPRGGGATDGVQMGPWSG